MNRRFSTATTRQPASPFGSRQALSVQFERHGGNAQHGHPGEGSA